MINDKKHLLHCNDKNSKNSCRLLCSRVGLAQAVAHMLAS